MILRGKSNQYKRIVFQKISDVGETSEGLSDEQNEEVTEPSEEVSDEGNSEEEGDDIANDDPANEDPVEEEPSEDEVEDPTTEEEEDTISDSTMSVSNGEEETEKPDKPTITVKIGETKLTDKATVAHDAEVLATLETPENAGKDAKIYYTLDDKVTLDGKNGEEYKDAVKLPRRE